MTAEIRRLTHGRGADAVIEAAGGQDTFSMAWQIARPNAVVALVAMYEKPQLLPLPDMYGKNLIFKTGGVDACHCGELLGHIAARPVCAPIFLSPTGDRWSRFSRAIRLLENGGKTA